MGGKEKEQAREQATGWHSGPGYQEQVAVIALVERNGSVLPFQVEDVKGQTIRRIVVDNVVLGSRMYTDEFKSYLGLAPWYRHEACNHSAGYYVVGEAHTNSAEGFFSLLKRGIFGIYHQVSRKHMTAYLNEFAFRYNHRKAGSGYCFDTLLAHSQGRLTYQALIAK